MATNLPNFDVVTTRVKNNEISSLLVDGNLIVGGAIFPGTFTNRVITLVDAGAAGAITGGPVTAAQSGTTFVIPTLTNNNQTLALPAAAPGLKYKFVYNNSGAAIGFDLNLVRAGTDTISGFAVGVDGNAGVTFNNGAVLAIDSSAVAGTWIKLEGLATGSTTTPNAWHLSAQCAAAASILNA